MIRSGNVSAMKYIGNISKAYSSLVLRDYMCHHKLMDKLQIIKTISDDAPHSPINWLAMSFLTPQKMKDLETYDIKGFKIHNGYTAYEMVEEDVKKIRANHMDHDVFIAQMGKVCAWDDITKVNDVIYDNKKLTSIEKARKEDMETMKVLYNQKLIDSSEKPADDKKRATAIKQRFLDRLHASGKLTKNELDAIKSKEKLLEKIRHQ